MKRRRRRCVAKDFTEHSLSREEQEVNWNSGTENNNTLSTHSPMGELCQQAPQSLLIESLRDLFFAQYLCFYFHCSVVDPLHYFCFL